jgi:hypothetical protein
MGAIERASKVKPDGQVDWRSYAHFIRVVGLAQQGMQGSAESAAQDIRDIVQNENGGHLVAALLALL